MNFDTSVKRLIAWNVGSFQGLMIWLSRLPTTKETTFLFSLAKFGYQSNLALRDTLDQLTLMPGDEDAEEFETAYQHTVGQAVREVEISTAATPTPKDIGTAKDIQELERIYNLKEEEALNKGKNATKSNNRISAGDWYERLFADKSKGLTGSKEPAGETGERSE